MLDGHCGIHDWEIILIDKGRNKQEVRKKSFWGNISWTHFVPYGEVDLEWI